MFGKAHEQQSGTELELWQDELMRVQALDLLQVPMHRFVWLFTKYLGKSYPTSPVKAMRLLSTLSGDNIPEGFEKTLFKDNAYRHCVSCWIMHEPAAGDADEFLPAYAHRPIPPQVKCILNMGNIVNDMEILWRHAIYAQGCGEEMTSLCLNFNKLAAASKLRTIGDELGVYQFVEAYFSGVPISDIIGDDDEYEQRDWEEILLEAARDLANKQKAAELRTN